MLSILLIGIYLPCAAIAQGGSVPALAIGKASEWRLNAASVRAQPSPTVRIGAVVKDCPDCPEMVRIPGLGQESALFAGRFEITWHEYLVAAREASCGMPWADNKQFPVADADAMNDTYPVSGLTFDQIQCYIAWLSKKSGKRYRLPSAAEWEHLARAGTKTEYYWGNGVGVDHAAINGHFDRTAIWDRVGKPSDYERRFAVKWGVVMPVGSFPPNPWGLYDTIGNAIEATTEVMPPFPACLRLGKPERCAIYAGRGNGINLDYVDGAGSRLTATTGRHPIARFGGGALDGLRVVRNQ
jgi:hypothetical protein